ncbi:hypothetical protein SASPL_115406 [Salvia splendens]|uniref:Uncharacterized protein n=1 Tax=Salvia splendens TaxID=180675 RepID=A0A8X8Y7Y0_SALSN|nr:hypothetical protein SASPL_115406 [Salvia splendens]
MVVSASIRRVPISSSQNGGIALPMPSRPPIAPHRLHFRPQDDSQDGASGFGDSQLEIALRHFIRLPPSIHLNPSFDHSVAFDIIINTIRVIDFTRFPPSVIAAAAALSAGGMGADTFDERINRLMEEYLLDTCPDRVKATPLSPLGVLDATACANHSENPPSSDSEIKRPRLSALDVEESL